MAAIIQPLLEKRYRRLEHETGPKKPRGWQAVDIAREFVDAVDAFEPKWNSPAFEDTSLTMSV